MEDYLSNVTLKDILDKNGKQMIAGLKPGQDFSI
jgi:hypothetical protein